MKHTGLIVLLCSALCLAQPPEPLFAGGFDPVEQPDFGPGDDYRELIPELPDLDGEGPLIHCGPFECDLKCSYGLTVGDDGCPLCKCRTPEDLCNELGECPEGMQCEVPICFGEMCDFVMAKCMPVECPVLMCDPCPSGLYVENEQGCQTCECQDFPCPMPMCSEPCEFGFATDERGCMTCTCKEDSQEEERSERSDEYYAEEPSEFGELSLEDKCPKPTCRMYCEYDFQRDEDGCQICKCRTQPEDCPGVMCLMFCDFGFEKNEHGCDICKCRRQPVGCGERECDTLLDCPNGFVKDAHGCDTCLCKTETDAMCAEIECRPGLSCKPAKQIFCSAEPCPTTPLCQPPSVCELHQGHPLTDDEAAMMVPHLSVLEQMKLFQDPVKCRPDGHFEPKQCVGEKCYCIDDRRVVQAESRKQNELTCVMNVTREIGVSFELMHDLDDNDLDGALKDIEELVQDMVSDWMSLQKDSILTVEVVYIKPGVLLVFTKVLNDGFSDLLSSSHNFHKEMFAGNCNLNYKHHELKPDPDTIRFEHHYEPEQDPQQYFTAESRYGITEYNTTGIIITAIGVIVLVGIVVLSIALCVMKRRAHTYQFRHKRMDHMETFKKNLVLNAEMAKPYIISNDKDKVAVTIEAEKTPQ